MITHLFCDIGGVILDEDDLYRVYLGEVHRTLRDHGVDVSAEEFANAVRECILSWVPILRRAIIWRFTRPDIARCNAIDAAARARFLKWHESAARGPVPGIETVLARLAERCTLVLAANAGLHVKAILRELDLLRFFAHTEVSEEIGVSKPDLRFFQHLLTATGANPHSCVMIGDRLDNDIVPAKALGLRTILVRRGPYVILDPRTPEEVPDATVDDVRQLPEILAALAQGPNT